MDIYFFYPTISKPDGPSKVRGHLLLPTRPGRLSILRPLTRRVRLIDSVLLVAKVIVGHDEREEDRHDGEACRGDDEDLHRVVVRCVCGV